MCKKRKKNKKTCQYTHGCCAPASSATRHTTVCLDINPIASDLLEGINLLVEDQIAYQEVTVYIDLCLIFVPCLLQLK